MLTEKTRCCIGPPLQAHPRWNWGFRDFSDARSSDLFITVSVTFATFTDSFLYGLFIPVTPTALTERVGLSPEDVQRWTSILVAVHAAALSCMSLTAAYLCPAICGYIADKVKSRRRALLVGFVFSAVGIGIMCAGSNLAIWVTGRILLGASSAVIGTLGITLIVDSVDPSHLGQYMGYNSLGFAAGMPAGPLLGGVIYHQSGYYSVFITALAFITTAVILCVSILERTTQPDKVGNQRKADDDAEKQHRQTFLGEQSQPVNGNGCSRRRAPTPLVLLSDPRILICVWDYWITAFLSTSFDAVLPLYVHELFGWNQMGSGLVFLALTLPVFIDPVTGAICDRWPKSPRYIACTGLLLSIPVLVCLRFVDHDTISQKVLLCVLLFMMGFIMSSVQVPALLDVNTAVKARQEMDPALFGKRRAIGQAYGLCVGSYGVGSIVGPLFAGFIRDSAGWATMAWALAIVSGFSAIPTFLLLGGWFQPPR